MAGQGFTKPIYVRADGRAPYAIVAQVMASLSTSGFTQHQPDHRHRRPVLRLAIRSTGGRRGWPAMTSSDLRRRGSLTPALAAAAALHVGVFILLVFVARPSPIPVGSAVPINIVSNAPTTDTRPAVAAPETQDAQTETPAAEAPPPAPTPEPTPTAAPPKPTPKPPAPRPTPSPAPKPTPPTPKATAKPTPSPATARKTAASDTDFLDSLQASIASAAKSSPPRPASGKRGPSRAETAPQARFNAGAGVSQSDIDGLRQLLQRLWNPNCSIEGGDAVIVPVKFSVDGDGGVVGRVSAGGRENSSDPVVFAAARRAIDAVHRGAPYGPPYRGQSFALNFDAKKACSQG